MIAVASLLLVVLVGLLITRVATAALVTTGLSTESARFQARSAFTGAGFTTTEAESVVAHPVRRRVVMFLMLAGNAGIATVAVGLLLGFSGSDAGTAGRRVLVLVGGLFVIFLAAKSRVVDQRLRKVLGAGMRRYSDIEVRDYAELLRVAGDYVVDELAVQEEDWMAGRELAELRLRDEGVVVLGIDRNGVYTGTPGPETELSAGDTLVVYGRDEVIRDLDDRRNDRLAASAHEERAVEHDQIRELESHEREAAREHRPA